MYKRIIVSILFFNIFAVSAWAGVFNVTTTYGGSSTTKSYSTAEDVMDAVKLAKIAELFPGYETNNGTEAVSINIDFRGLPMGLSFAGGGTALTLSVPAIGLTQVFNGATRDASQDLFKQWLKTNGGPALNDLIKKLAELSPHDPLAGNPTSLMGKMVSQDFDRAVRPNNARPGKGKTMSVFELAIKVGRYKMKDGTKASSISLPLSYTNPMDFNPKHQLIVDFPISYYEVEKSKSYNLNLGVGYKFPIESVSPNWFITPAIGTGVVGSIDLASAGQIVAGSITSEYSKKIFDKYRLGIGNMIGRYQTRKLKIGDYESDPGIKNTVLRNGLVGSMGQMIFSWKAEIEAFILDTRYFGTELYMDKYNEVGFSIGSNKEDKKVTKYLRLGLSFLLSSKTKGTTLNFGYSF